MIKIDAEKLAAFIRTCLRETDGPCVSTGACIGKIDGKEIQLRVMRDEEDFMNSPKKFACVKSVPG